MNGSSHEFFVPDSATAPDRSVTLLSDHFETRRIQENEALHDSTVPDYFVVPDWLCETTPDTTQIVDVVGKAQLRLSKQSGRGVEYAANQIRALNIIFEAGKFITSHEIITKIGEQKTAAARRQHRALEELYDKVCRTTGGFLVRQECDGTVAYAVDEKVSFNDRRNESQLAKEVAERKRVLRTVCAKFSDDPALLREVKTYSISPLESIPSDWRMHEIARYQTRDFEIIPRTEEQVLLHELDMIVAACTDGSATEHDQLRAAILCNKLICSYLGLGYAVAFSTLGTGTKTVKSSVQEFMAYFPKNSMDKPEDDAYALAGLGVVNAVYTYDSSRGSLANHVITQVGIAIRDGILDDRRHLYGKTHHEMELEGAIHGVRRRVFVSDNDEENGTYGELPEPRTPAIDEKLQEVISAVNTKPFVRAIFRSEELRPAEKLILSLTQGIYNEEFEGNVLRSANGHTFTYDQSLQDNPLFREGMTDREVSRMFDVSVSQIARLRESAMKKVGAMMRSKLFMQYSAEKWKDWIW